jgi:hypothetical protein
MTKKCQFRKKNGERCGADAQIGKSICVFHDPARASDGQRARRAGGVNRTRPAAVLPADTPDHPLATPKDVSGLLAQSINQVRRGQLDPKVANCVGYLSGVLLHSIEQGSVEERLARLEAVLVKNDSGSVIFDFRPKAGDCA